MNLIKMLTTEMYKHFTSLLFLILLLLLAIAVLNIIRVKYPSSVMDKQLTYNILPLTLDEPS
jgi:hypothetical protein